MKNISSSFIYHLRSYRAFHFMFFTFLLLITSLCFSYFGDYMYAASQPDLLQEAFGPAMTQETVINLWEGKNAVGNEVLREGVGIQTNLWQWCFVNGEKLSPADLESQKNQAWSTLWNQDFCQQILWWDWNVPVLTTEAPLIVRIAKFLLRITMVLAVTMVIFNGVMRIIESSKWGDVKDAKKNITMILIGLLIALMSLGIINLISSISVSTLSTVQ